MKLTDTIQPEQITLERQNEAKKTLKHIGKVKLQPGQKLFELSMKEQLIRVVDVNQDVAIDIKGAVRKKVILKEDCIYTPALNLKNAEKKFLKMLST